MQELLTEVRHRFSIKKTLDSGERLTADKLVGGKGEEPFQHLFTLDGNPVESILDVPANAKILIASRFSKMKGVNFLDHEMSKRIYHQEGTQSEAFFAQHGEQSVEAESQTGAPSLGRIEELTFANGMSVDIKHSTRQESDA